MTLSNLSSDIAIVDGGLALVSSGALTSAKVGGCSGGVAGTFYTFAGADTQAVSTTLGVGPLVDSVVQHLLESKGAPVLAYKATTSTAGSSSAVVNAGGGPTVTLSGAALDQSESVIEIMVAGAIGTSQFRYTLDGGDTWSDNYATAATFLLPNGVTANMPVGAYVLGATYTWTDTAPGMTTTNVGDALDAIIVSPFDVEFTHVVGQAADGAAAATMATLLSTKITSAHASHKYMWIVFEGPPADKTAVATAFAAYVQKFVVGCGGFAEIVNPISSRIQKRSSGRVLVPRFARNPIYVHPIRDEADSVTDAFTSVNKLVPAGAAASTGYHDEEKTPGYTAARFCSLRTISGKPGYYASNGITFAAGTSDFQSLMAMRIVLAAARAWYTYTLDELGRRLQTDPDTGFIDGRFADGAETAGKSRLQTALGTAVRRIQIKVNRADNIGSEGVLRAKIRLVISGYLYEYESEIGLAEFISEAA